MSEKTYVDVSFDHVDGGIVLISEMVRGDEHPKATNADQDALSIVLGYMMLLTCR